MTYTYDCPNCGRVELSRPVDERKETKCQCGATVTRVANDFSRNLKRPFVPFRVLGLNGAEHAEIGSASERDEVLHRESGWREDYEMPRQRYELMDLKEFGRERGFKERPEWKAGRTVAVGGQQKE
jgi:hypothetical protein